MGFFGNVFSSVVKVALTPVAVVKDVVNVAQGKEADTTKELINSAINDLKEAGEDLTDF